ncbi:MAG: HU family DNA-binding protein [Eubacteriales bacterium]
MNKAQLVDSISQKTGMKKKDAEAALNAVVGTIEEALVSGDKVQIMGFGTFEVKQREERKGRNPSTKEEIIIPASKHPSFTAGKSLKTVVNS